jgi:hypothetical protein
MLHSIQQLYGAELDATDGHIGQVKDFYFEDSTWAVRYLVAETGSWLAGRQVLISPHALDRLDRTDNFLRVNLTRQQIENSPLIASHQPITREFEEAYYRYYGWPYYWEGEALWGISGFPILGLSAKAFTTDSNSTEWEGTEEVEHLRSAQVCKGYHLRTDYQTIGHICDFMMEAQSWAMRHLVIKTGHRLAGKEILISTKEVDRVSDEESTVHVNLGRAGLEPSSSHYSFLTGATH